MTFTSHGAHVWNKTNIALYMITICAFIPLHAATSLTGRSNIKSTNGSTAQDQNQLAPNETIGDPINKSLNNPSFPISESLPEPTFASEGVIETGQLLIDPSFPIYRTDSPDEVQVSKPSKLVGSALLTAATPSPTAPHNLTNTSEILKNRTSHELNQTRKMPLLSGSMTIALPIPTPTVPPAAAAPNGSLSLSNQSSSAATGFVTPDANVPGTPTTSTQFVYATNAPAPFSPASDSMNSAGCHVIPTSSYRSIGLSLVYLTLLFYSLH